MSTDRMALFHENWPRLPRTLQACLRSNTRVALTEDTKERNRAYMVGLCAAYRELDKMDDELYSFALALINAEHMDEAIQAAPF